MMSAPTRKPYSIPLDPGSAFSGVTTAVNVEGEAGEACDPPGGVGVRPGAAGLPGSRVEVAELPVAVDEGGWSVRDANVGPDWVETAVARGELVGGTEVGGNETGVLLGDSAGVTTVGGGAVGTV